MIFLAIKNDIRVLASDININHKKENMEPANENTGRKYVTLSPTFIHAHPYFEKAYLQATKSDRRSTRGVSPNNCGQNIYTLKFASINMLLLDTI